VSNPIPKLLEQHSKSLCEIHSYFGYEPEWRVYPIDDMTDVMWKISGTVVKFMDGKGIEYEMSTYGTNPIYKGAEYTMICVDTQTDGNKFLSIFDNSKEVSSFKPNP
jgi:hypothetical protein